MAIFNGEQPVWGRHFSVDNGEQEGFIRLAQRTDTHFKLESHISYGGATGLEDLELSDESWRLLRNLTPADLDDTDLASIPAPMRWWINTYGRHTPAALIHDRFIGEPAGMPQPLQDDGIGEHHIDRYFRFMLGDAGIPFTDRWIMWSAVALRTRWMAKGRKRAFLAVWFALAFAGMLALLWALLQGQIALACLFGIAPLPAALLWGRQWGAAIVAAYIVFPFLLVPIGLALVLIAPFYLFRRRFSRMIERAARRLFPRQIEPSFYATNAISVPGRRNRPAVPGLDEAAQSV